MKAAVIAAASALMIFQIIVPGAWAYSRELVESPFVRAQQSGTDFLLVLGIGVVGGAVSLGALSASGACLAAAAYLLAGCISLAIGSTRGSAKRRATEYGSVPTTARR